MDQQITAVIVNRRDNKLRVVFSLSKKYFPIVLRRVVAIILIF